MIKKIHTAESYRMHSPFYGQFLLGIGNRARPPRLFVAHPLWLNLNIAHNTTTLTKIIKYKKYEISKGRLLFARILTALSRFILVDKLKNCMASEKKKSSRYQFFKCKFWKKLYILMNSTNLFEFNISYALNRFEKG